MPKQDDAVAALERAGHPVVRIAVTDRYHIGQEFFRWEIATAVAGAILGINPFDQPDVEASKDKTRELTAAYEKTRRAAAETALLRGGRSYALCRCEEQQGIRKAPGRSWNISRHISRVFEPATIARSSPMSNATSTIATRLQDIRVMIRDRKRVATCLGFGPRFLHSTGQAYKGGPNTGVFLQITCDDAADLQVPDQKYTFGVVKAAEARGDFEVLAERGRRVLARPSRLRMLRQA